jgi:prepilin-type processing-associated H-X9-DG protein
VYEQVAAKGSSLAVSVTGGKDGPPSAYATVVLHEGAGLEPGLAEFVKRSLGQQVEFNSKDVSGRKITSTIIPNSPGVEVGWWTDGKHLVVVAGLQAVENAMAVATGKSPNITTGRLWKEYRSGKTGFELSFVTWLDFGSLRDTFADMPLPPIPGKDEQVTVGQIVAALGFDKMGAFVSRSGYKGKATWSETTLEAPAPRTGLLAFGEQEPITLADLPPMPAATNGFFACSVDWSKTYDDTIRTVRKLADLAPPDAAAQVEGAIDQLPAIIGLDLKKDLFDALGNVLCIYGDAGQGPFGMGFGIVLEVKDAKTLRATVTELLGRLAEQTNPRDVVIRRATKEEREVITVEIGGGFLNPSLCVDDKWLVMGLMPQTIEAFFMRANGGLKKWEPAGLYREGLAELPDKFTCITATDPRETYRTLLGMAPLIMGFMQAGMRQSGAAPDFQIPITVADLPPAEAVIGPLFPNISVSTVDEKGLHSRSRSSLPSVPLFGLQGGAMAPVAVALLLPAVQQARTAARRSQSTNNLKMLGLAMHNYHDVHSRFPQGAHENEKLKVEKRFSWITDLLPYLDQAALFNQLDLKQAWDAEANAAWTKTTVPLLKNPGVAETKPHEFGTTHYVGIAGLGKDAPTLPVTSEKAGVFGYNRATRIQDIRDGTSNTMMITETHKDFGPWSAGGPSTIRSLTTKPYINGPDGIGGPTPGGCNILLADGSVRFVSESVDPKIFEAISTIRGGETVGGF